MKKLIMLTVITACIALCAAVWPQGKTVGETPEPKQELAVIAPEAPAATHKEETKAQPQTEKETAEPPQPELPMETVSEPEPAPTEIPAAPTVPVPECTPTGSIVIPEPGSEPTLEPLSNPEITHPQETAPSPTPTVIDVQPGDMVYVEGFGWLESQGAGTVIHDETIYESGNKVGSMG